MLVFHMPTLQAIPNLSYEASTLGSAILAFQSMEGGKAEDITVTCNVRGSETHKAEHRPPVHYSKLKDEMGSQSDKS